jgi:hypothetical protein
MTPTATAATAAARAAAARAAAAAGRGARIAAERHVRAFLGRLHARLRGRCFASGAFVLELPPASARVRGLLTALARGSARRPLARTHDAHQHPAKLAAHRVCAAPGAGGCAADARGLRAGPQMEFRLSPPARGLCPGDPTEKGVALWYHFSLGRRRYLFLKLEGHPAVSPAHAWAALRRYAFKAPAKTRLAVRRENAYKDAGRPVAREALEASRRDAELWPRQAAGAAFYDAALRTGLEVFVPAAVVADLA